MASTPRADDARLKAAIARWVTDEPRQGLIVTDPACCILLWNRWMEIHSGLAAADVMGHSLFDLYSDAPALVKEYFDHARAGRVTVLAQALHHFLLPMRPTNPDLPYAEMPQSGRVGPLLDGTEVLGIVTVLEDVSDRLAGELELRRQIDAQQLARAAAESALRAKDEFLSTLSHEIRTPLNAMLGWTRVLLMQDRLEPALLERALHVIERNATAQAKMIDDMLDMARVVSGKLRIDHAPVNLLDVVLGAVDVVLPLASARRVSLRTALDPATPHVLGDRDRLQQVTWNLLSNSLKFTDPGGSVEVSVHAAGNAARIVVRDTGQGISPEFLPHVFERFRQNDASSTRRHGGLGLGLGLVRELVQLHGGTVSAMSPGANLGATFTIELPAARMSELPEVPGSAPADRRAPPSLAGVRVLLVEDEADSRDLTALALGDRGAVVTAVSSSAEALSAMQRASTDGLPHVLVSDIGMPVEDGYELIRKVRSLQPHRGGLVPALGVTGYAAPNDVERALAAGYQRHLAKPIDPSTLIAVVAELARQSDVQSQTS